jgi:hypothetical protein
MRKELKLISEKPPSFSHKKKRSAYAFAIEKRMCGTAKAPHPRRDEAAEGFLQVHLTYKLRPSVPPAWRSGTVESRSRTPRRPNRSWLGR